MNDISMDTENHWYLIDGASLLGCIISRKDKIYGEIKEHCPDFVGALYGKYLMSMMENL